MADLKNKLGNFWFWLTYNRTTLQYLLIVVAFAIIFILPWIIIQYSITEPGQSVPDGHWTTYGIVGSVCLWFSFVVVLMTLGGNNPFDEEEEPLT